jgi:hypothetical protein
MVIDPRAQLWIAQAHRDWLDVDGRPLGEQASPDYPKDTHHVACPYSGARRGLPMNQDAVEQVRRHHTEVLGRLSAALPPEPRVEDVLRVATGALVAPLFEPRPVPAVTSAAYKTDLGFHQVLVSLLLDTPGLAATPAASLPGPDALLHVLDAGRWLVGQVQACGGSPAEIALHWEVLCGRRRVAGTPTPGDADWGLTLTALVLALVLGSHERLAATDREGLVGFGTEAADVERWPLGARLWHRRTAPWILSATAKQDRKAAQVLNLFATPPECVRRLVETTGSHAALEAAFWDEVAALAPPRVNRAVV